MTECRAPGRASAATTRAQHWHAGFNQPWHAPRSVPGTYNSFEDARQSLARDMELHARSEEAYTGGFLCSGDVCETHGDACGWRRAEAIRAARGDLLRSQGPSWSGSAAGLSYWVTECPGCPPVGATEPGLEAAASA